MHHVYAGVQCYTKMACYATLLLCIHISSTRTVNDNDHIIGVNYRMLFKTEGLILLNSQIFPYKRDNVYCSGRILVFFKWFGIFQGFPHCKNAAKLGGFGGKGNVCLLLI